MSTKTQISRLHHGTLCGEDRERYTMDRLSGQSAVVRLAAVPIGEIAAAEAANRYWPMGRHNQIAEVLF